MKEIFDFENEVLLYCTNEASSREVLEALQIGEEKYAEVQQLLADCQRAYDEAECDDEGLTFEQSRALDAAIRPYILRLRALATDTEAERRRIGARIRQLRTDEDVTQQQLAFALGLDRAYISKIEAGEHSVGVDILAAASQVLGRTLKIE